MNLTYLDNPGWYALNSHHSHLAIKGKIAARYQPDTVIGAAMLENNTIGFRDLEDLVEVDEMMAVFGSIPTEMTGWEIMETVKVPQMICQDLKPAPHVAVIDLSSENVPEMLDLVAKTQPGPFLKRTIEMGRYYGVKQDDKLVAMAGERLHLEGFCEISAVCTHPDYRGRGYAGALTTLVAERIFERNEVPFLHVAPTNHVARRLYSRLGFALRNEIQLTILKRLA